MCRAVGAVAPVRCARCMAGLGAATATKHMLAAPPARWGHATGAAAKLLCAFEGIPTCNLPAHNGGQSAAVPTCPGGRALRAAPRYATHAFTSPCWQRSTRSMPAREPAAACSHTSCRAAAAETCSGTECPQHPICPLHRAAGQTAATGCAGAPASPVGIFPHLERGEEVVSAFLQVRLGASPCGRLNREATHGKAGLGWSGLPLCGLRAARHPAGQQALQSRPLPLTRRRAGGQRCFSHSICEHRGQRHGASVAGCRVAAPPERSAVHQAGLRCVGGCCTSGAGCLECAQQANLPPPAVRLN